MQPEQQHRVTQTLHRSSARSRTLIVGGNRICLFDPEEVAIVFTVAVTLPTPAQNRSVFPESIKGVRSHC